MKWLALTMLLGIGCGGETPSTFQLCNKRCDANKRCGFANEAETNNCKVACSSTKAQSDATDQANSNACKNYADVQNLANGCYDRPCTQVNDCLAAIDTTCVPK